MTPIDGAAANQSGLRAYRAYGLTIGCDFEAPELTPANGEPLDVRVVRGPLPRALPQMSEGVVFEFQPDAMYFGWPTIGHFLLSPDNTVYYDAEPGSEHMLSFALLGPVLSVILHRAGRLLLHSSAVARGPDVSFFLGDKGAGKSTTAAALVGSGFELVTDDLLVLETHEDAAPTVSPGYPQLKLAPEADALLGDTHRSELRRLSDKSRVRLQSFSQAPRTVAAGYVLKRGGEPGRRRLDPVASLGALMRYSYITRFGRRLLDSDGLARHLKQCASVANGIPIYELGVPADLQRLSDIATHLGDNVGE